MSDPARLLSEIAQDMSDVLDSFACDHFLEIILCMGDYSKSHAKSREMQTTMYKCSRTVAQFHHSH